MSMFHCHQYYFAMVHPIITLFNALGRAYNKSNHTSHHEIRCWYNPCIFICECCGLNHQRNALVYSQGNQKGGFNSSCCFSHHFTHDVQFTNVQSIIVQICKESISCRTFMSHYFEDVYLSLWISHAFSLVYIIHGCVYPHHAC